MSDRTGVHARIGTAPVVVPAIIAVVVLAALVPALVNSFHLFVLTLIAIFALAGAGLTVIMGWTGQVALAHVGFVAIGAYGASYLTNAGLAWPLAALLAAALSAVVGAVIGFPAARLRGFYLAIATLAFGELVQRVAVTATPITGGVAGQSVIPVALGPFDPATSLWYLSFVLFALGLLLVRRISRSGLGRCLLSVKEMEVAVGANGISALRLKVLAFAVSAVFGSVAGSLFGQALSYLTPDTFSATLLIQLLVIVFIGGTTYLAGPVIGAALVVVLQQVLQDLGSWQTFVYGGALVLTMRFLPLGIASLPARLRRARAGGRGRRSAVVEGLAP
ncbi:branched-chain amino acid ABC transporter permease [Pseudonocardia sp. GCM10023141]|uniref:branched-chain amino acid ABC transporter permease n=1 Tax=Pseudonocardia sp. GCM10023141 TaxID=3252653 RepID=UPI00361896B0